MTNLPPESPSEPPRRNLTAILWRWLKKPSTLVGGGILLTLGVATYAGMQYFAYQRLSPLLSSQLSQLLQRPVNVGEVESFSLNHIRIGQSTLPKTPTDPDHGEIKEILINFNLLPIFVGLPLAATVTVTDPNFYIEQDKTGKWLELPDFPEGEKRDLPIGLDIKVNLKDADVALVPNALKKTVTLQAEGSGGYLYRGGKDQKIRYDLEAQLLGSAIQLEGESDIAGENFGQTQADILIQELNLRELAALIPKSVATVNKGTFQADFNLNVPSLERIEGTKGNGNIDLSNLAAQIPTIKRPIQANIALNLAGQKLFVEQLNLSVGQLNAQVKGNVDWQQGLNLNIDLKPFQITELLQVINAKLPIELIGEVRSKIQVRGKVLDPIVTGVIENTKPIRLAKTNFKKLEAQFQATFDRILLSQLQAVPTEGGIILAKGQLKTDFKDKIENNKKTNWTTLPLALDFTANLPTQELLKSYITPTQTVTFSPLKATGSFKGTWQNLQGKINWNAPKPSQVAGVGITGEGEILLSGQNFSFDNTLSQTNGGKADLKGKGSFKTNKLQAVLEARSFALSPFIPIVCQNFIECPDSVLTQQVSVTKAKINLGANLNQLSLDKINANVDALLDINEGNVNVNALLRQGNISGNFQTASLNLNPYIAIYCQETNQCPSSLLTQNIRVRNARGRLTGNINQLNLDQLKGALNANLMINEGDFVVAGTLSQGNLDGNLQTSEINLNPYVRLYCQETGQCPEGLLTQNLFLRRATGNISGNIERLNLNQLQGELNAVLGVDDGNVNVDGNLSQGILTADILTSQVNLNPFLPNLTVPARVNRAKIDLTASLPELLEKSPADLTSVNLNLNSQLSLAGSPVNAIATVKRGILDLVANTGRLPLDRIFPNLPISASLLNSNVNIAGNLNALIQSLNTTPDLSSFEGTATANALAAEGKINVDSRLNGNQFTADIVANGVKPRAFCSLVPAACSDVSILQESVDATADVSGNLGQIFGENATLPLTVSSFNANWDDQRVKGDGRLLITDLTRQPDIATANFNINARSNLNRLPLEEILTLIPVKRTLLPQELDLTGLGEFSGQFSGKNLLTAPTAAGNTQLVGNVSLTNFSFNQRPFEPLLQGTLNAGLGRSINLNLQGQQDVIAAKLDPCTRSDCAAPYLPTSFAIKQIYEDNPPLVAVGERKGDRLLAEIDTFSLDLLKIAPLEEYGINGFIRGGVKLTTDINLFTLDGRGTLEIDQPGIGLIEGDKITAQLAYENGVAQLEQGRLVVGRSNYDLIGSLNFNSGAIFAKLDVDRGYVEDILTALKISDIQSLVNLLKFRAIDYASASVLKPTPQAGDVNATIASQVNLLAVIDRKIKEYAEILQKGGIPTELDIRGAFTTAVTLDGTLQDPQLMVAFQGDRWQWQPQPPIPNIVPPLGLITEGDQAIPIRDVRLLATLEDGVVKIQTAGLQLRDMVADLQGTLSVKEIQSNFVISNLSVDTVKEFVDIPLDFTGDLNLTGTISGQTFNPKVQGNFAFTEGAINARRINQDIKGQFLYENARLITQTTAPDSIQLYASLPYPAQPEVNDQVDVRVRIGTEALKWINLLTQDQIVWLDGQGDVNLDVTGTLNTQDKFDFRFVAQGQVNLENTTFASSSLPGPLVVNGQINFTRDIIQIDQLQGQYANSNVLITGALPIFEARSLANPLTVAIEKASVDITGLYTGEVEGLIQVTQTALKPTIRGNVTLANGQIFVPKSQKTAETSSASLQEQLAYQRWFRPNLQRPQFLPIVPTLQDFTVSLEALSVEQLPLYGFDFGGVIQVNGTLNTLDLNQLRPVGEIKLSRGQINLVDTRFLLDRRASNSITFSPNQGIFNPDLDIAMRTIVSEIPNTRKRLSDTSNEILDDSLNRVQRIDVNLDINGQLRQILPNLGISGQQICDLHPDDLRPIRGEASLSEVELERMEQCIQYLAIVNAAEGDIIQSPAVKLSSRPPRTEGQIVRLLAEQFLAIADSLQTGNTEQLIQSGIVQIALPMVFQGVIYDIETSISDTIGSTDFRVVPFLEAIYSLNPEKEGEEVENPSFLRFSYDYTFNEFKVRYERQF